MKVLAIAINTAREAIRNRILYSILFFAVLMAAWQTACNVFDVPEFLLPSPLAIAKKIGEVPEPCCCTRSRPCARW